jgi:hypothetical protein
MAVTKQAYAAAVAPWAITAVCNDVRDAFIDAGLMASWFDSFTSGGYEHRVLEIIYDNSKAFGKTYYWFTFNGVGIWLRTVSGWNAGTHVPSGTQYVDFFDSNTTALDSAFRLLTLSTSISFSCTRYTSSGRSFLVLRTGSDFVTFTIDPASTTFRAFYDLAKGYHEGFFRVITGNQLVGFACVNRSRRSLLLGSSLNNSSFEAYFRTQISVCNYVLSRSAGSYSDSSYPANSAYLLPGWTTAANPSAGSDYNPVFTGLRLSSVHAADLPADFGVSCIKKSNTLNIQDNATVAASVEEYEILNFRNDGFDSAAIANNATFLARTVG